MIWSIALVVTSALIVGGYAWYRSVYSFWKRRNIPGPTPLPLLGNVLEMTIRRRQDFILDWSRKYGKVYGVFAGSIPRLFIADAELIHQLSVKDFNYMPNHDQELNKDLMKYMGNALFNLTDDDWRRVRCLTSPSFTSSKIRKMFGLLEDCGDDLIGCVNEKVTTENEIVNSQDAYSLYSMNGIASCCYALKLGRSNSDDHKSKAARDFFIKCMHKFSAPNYWSLILHLILPSWLAKYFGFYCVNDRHLEPVAARVEKVIKHRRESRIEHEDLLQLMVNAKLTKDLELNEFDAKEYHYANLTSKSLNHDQEQMTATVDKSKGYLTDVELMSNATIFLVAGLETTSSLITMVSYCIAHHPEIQMKLYQELKKSSDNGKVDYESLVSCQYLDCIVSEAMRLFTPVTSSYRHLARDYRLDKYNIDLPKGMRIMLNYHSVMNDPEYWPEPEKFKPDRFALENRHKIVVGSFCPFGFGPRHCIGMRFALLSTKLSIAKIVLNFKLSPAPGTTFPPVVDAPVSLLSLDNPRIRFEKRIE